LGRKSVAKLGETLEVAPGIVHDWWNLGLEEAKVAVEIEPATRFEEMIRNFFGLAQDGKTNAKGVPRLLQLALLACDFDALAGLVGYRGSYPPATVLPRQID
jgi:hypothetical protein